jgi:hypothetical protein
MDGAVTRRVSTIAVLVAIAAGSASAQQSSAPSLAEVARKAEAAKPTIRKAKRTYTNASLGGVSQDQRADAAPVAGAVFESRSLGKALPAEEMVARSEAKVESDNAGKQSQQTWQMRAASLRKQIDDMQSRLSTLTVPNALTEANPAIKQANDRDIANARTALDGLRKQWARLEAAAREDRVPGGWLDPRPQFQ